MVDRSNPHDHPGVMVSSTYSDLEEHREAVVEALLRVGFFPIGMEFDSAKAGKDVIDSSMEMVAKARAYVGIVSHRYGRVPKDAARNPKKLSITELEYREALGLGIPVFMFVMSDDHPVKATGFEKVTANRKKLEALKADIREHAIYAKFSSVEELAARVIQSMSEFKEKLASLARESESPRDRMLTPHLPVTVGFKEIAARRQNIFISHIAEESELAMILKKHIETDFLSLVETFVSSDSTSIPDGSKWLNHIDNVLKDTQVVIILCSKKSIKRPWINFELGAGWIKRVPIVPVCHSRLWLSDLPSPLNALQAVDANQQDSIKMLYQLIAKTIGCSMPLIDFGKIVAEIKDFENKYDTEVSDTETQHLGPTPLGKKNKINFDVFLSYANPDQQEADKIFQAIIDAGGKVFLARKSLKPGDDFADEIRDAIRASRAFWLLLSPNSLKSDWVVSEWGAAWALRKRIIPILHRCRPEDLPDRISRLHCIDFYEYPDLIKRMFKS